MLLAATLSACAPGGTRDAPMESYTAEELYFGPLLMRDKVPAFVTKWQRMLRQKQQTLANFERARDAIPEEKRRDFARQISWISQVLA